MTWYKAYKLTCLVAVLFISLLVWVGEWVGGWVGAGLIKIKTKLSPQLGSAKLELGLSLAIGSAHELETLSLLRIFKYT